MLTLDNCAVKNSKFVDCKDGVLNTDHVSSNIYSLNNKKQALQRVFFAQEEYTAMLRLYNNRTEKDSLVNEVACEWMRGNPLVWSQWKPSDLTVKTELYIGGIFPITGPFYKSGRGMVPGIQMMLSCKSSISCAT